MASARHAAAEILIAVGRGHTTLAAELERARAGLPDPRDRALLFELTLGTLRWQGALDALLAQCFSRQTGEVDAAVRVMLRLAAYQLEYLTRVPAHAVLNDAVELTRTFQHPRAAGFVNAVLRTWIRRRKTLTLPVRPGTPDDRAGWIAYLSTTLSHPAWLVTRWLDRHGADAAERWCRFNNQPSPVAVRARRPPPAEAPPGVRPLRFVDDGWQLEEPRGDAPESEAGHAWIVQDEASQIVAHLAGARPGEQVLDLCAAPGGKTLVLWGDMGADGLLVACDTRPRRLRVLKTMLDGSAPARLVQVDATGPLPFGPIFDRVFVDAPCSGLGVLARDPDVKWTRQPDDLARLAHVQAQILYWASTVVKPGGQLVYATCSGEPEEDEDVIDNFLRRHSGFVETPPPAGSHVRRRDELVTARGAVHTWPFTHGLDAFYAAFLARRGT